MFQQTAGSIAIPKPVNGADLTITILGGQIAKGEMAEGILSLDAGVDYVSKFLHAR